MTYEEKLKRKLKIAYDNLNNNDCYENHKKLFLIENELNKIGGID